MMQAADDDEIFVYMGGDKEVPEGVRRARIHKSVKIIPTRAFSFRRQLIDVEFHDGIEIIGREAFYQCPSLMKVKLLGVNIIKALAFNGCTSLTDVEFGDKLETIDFEAFVYCTKLTNITMPSVRTIGRSVFQYCWKLSELELPEGLETLQSCAFSCCRSLRRIAIPWNCSIGERAFNSSLNISVHLVGGIHKTVASLHKKSWRNDMTNEINRINETLPNANLYQTTAEIQQWMISVNTKIDNYKSEHNKVLKEATTLLELALWKANFDEQVGGLIEREGVRTTRGSRKRARKETCIRSGASIVIKNVLPFLQLE